MNLYARDLSLFDFEFSAHVFESMSPAPLLFPSEPEPSDYASLTNRSPPKHRHDGTSPLPLGMDWSLPPQKWEGQESVWPHDSHTGWSYCVTVPSWTIRPKSSDSKSAALYRVQVGIQSPEGITTAREVLRRFNEFLELLSELKKAFPQKKFPATPSKSLLRIKTRTLLKERTRALEQWLEQLLSDIDISRSAPVAMFLELEAAARSSFDNMSPVSDATASPLGFQPKSAVSNSTSGVSDQVYESINENFEIGTSFSDLEITGAMETNYNYGMPKKNLESESISERLGTSSANNLIDRGENSGTSTGNSSQNTSKAAVPEENEIELLLEMENDKVKDLEVEPEITRNSCKDNLQQGIMVERERFTQIQWDVEELRKKCLEMELKLKATQEENTQAEMEKASLIQENRVLLQDLGVAREDNLKLQKIHEELEMKSKSDFKFLVEEVKTLRGSHLELEEELERVVTEKIEIERVLHKECKEKELAATANAKLLHECEILCNRLHECSVNFIIGEGDKLIIDASSPSDAMDLLISSNNRIGLLLAESQILAQDAETSVPGVDSKTTTDPSATNAHFKRMLTDTIIENASLRKQVNSVMRCALNSPGLSKKDEKEEEVSLSRTVLSKLLER